MAKTDTRAPGFAQESGQILVMTAVAMVALLAIAALSLDVSYMYDKRNRLHSAADAAAKSVAIEMFRNSSILQADMEAFADREVAAHGFSPTRLGGTTTVTVNHPPIVATGFNDQFVEVLVSEDTSTFFAKIIGRASMTPGASAVAGSGNPSNCLITNQNLTIGGGNTQITLNGCGAGVGGNLSVGNGASTGISGTPSPPVAVTGTCSGQCGVGHAGTLTTGTPPPTDPLAGLAPYPNPNGCQIGNTSSITPGCYSQITSNVHTLQAGNYYVTGDVTIGNNSTLAGDHVMIFLTGAGRINVTGNNANLTLTAPTSGTYKGIAIFQDVTDTNNWVAGNSFTLNITGVIYMPGTDVIFNNNPNFVSTQCNLFLSKSLNLGNGTGTFTNSGCSSLYGGAAFLTVTIVQ